jgi:peptidoglycan hydrolase-like protein with peptidoglycan-binding domain
MEVGPTLQEGTPPGPHSNVELLQRALRRSGFDPGPVNGGFGPTTAAAVRSFQAAMGLVVDGIVGPQTWRALPSEDMQGIPTLREGSSGGAVALLQRALRRSGFDPGPINGEFEASRPRSALLSMASSDLKRGVLLAKGKPVGDFARVARACTLSGSRPGVLF